MSLNALFYLELFYVITLFPELADMVENYVNALNTKGYVPDWQSAWDLTVKMAYQRAGM